MHRCIVVSERRELILLPSLQAYQDASGKLFVTKKYLDGAEMFQRYWPGKVTSLFARSHRPSTDLDQIELSTDSDAETHSSELRPTTEAGLAARLSGAMVALGFLSSMERILYRVCRRLDVPLVMTSEYSPRTEFQIIDAESSSRVKRAWRKAKTIHGETHRLAMLRGLAGIQCSGTPTYRRYRWFNRRALLFFDNRVRVEDILSEEDLDHRLRDLERSNGPLRLVFGGRFIAMKGVLELPRVAKALVRRGVPFTLDIVGDGPLRSDLIAAIERDALGDRVRVLPPMDFTTGWVPMLKQKADIFLCCHPQGDPSSTYPEAMSCGVPVAGYANEALRGVLAHSGGGWEAPMMRPDALVDQVARLQQRRAEIAAVSRKALRFAATHAFEHTFRRRTEHLVECSRLPVGSTVLTPPSTIRRELC